MEVYEIKITSLLPVLGVKYGMGYDQFVSPASECAFDYFEMVRAGALFTSRITYPIMDGIEYREGRLFYTKRHIVGEFVTNDGKVVWYKIGCDHNNIVSETVSGRQHEVCRECRTVFL